VISASEWKKFSSMEGKFSVWFPGNPERTNITDSASGFDLSMPSYFVWANRQTEYSVNYCDYPEEVIRRLGKFTPQQQFDFSQSDVVKVGGGKIVYQKDITIEGYPARDFEFVTGGKANYSGRVRLILLNGRLYQLIVIFLTANPHPKDWDIFFNSFQFQK
jgi:hypothetical protein